MDVEDVMLVIFLLENKRWCKHAGATWLMGFTSMRICLNDGMLFNRYTRQDSGIITNVINHVSGEELLTAKDFVKQEDNDPLDLRALEYFNGQK